MNWFSYPNVWLIVNSVINKPGSKLYKSIRVEKLEAMMVEQPCEYINILTINYICKLYGV
jgi:hypothetical protein